MTLLFDGQIGWSAYRQVRTQGYAMTTGIVTRSELGEGAGEDGSFYYPKISYLYHVAAKDYYCDRYRYGPDATGDRSAERIVAMYRKGEVVEVYYDKRNPSDAVLARGLEQQDLLGAMFMIPFNLAMIAFWYWACGSVYNRRARPAAGGAEFWDDGLCIRVRLPQMRSFYFGILVAGGFWAYAFVAFLFSLLVFHVAIPCSVIFAGIGTIFGGGYLAYLGHRWKLARGGADLVIDFAGRTVSLPRTGQRRTAVVIPLRQVTGVDVEYVEKRSSDDDDRYRFAPLLIIADDAGSTRREKLVEWYNQDRAESLAGWLRERLRIGCSSGF